MVVSQDVRVRRAARVKVCFWSASLPLQHLTTNLPATSAFWLAKKKKVVTYLLVFCAG